MENQMGTLPIKKLLLKTSVPVILSMLVSSLYNIIDSIFISRLGQDALTAMSLATPISSLIACVTVGFSVGMNAELSKKLGEKKFKEANDAAGNGLLINWLMSILFMIFGLFFVRSFYAFQTDVAHIQNLGVSYTSIICIFSFGVANQTMLERILISTGKSYASMFSLMTGTLVNLVLDPILIFGFGSIPALGMRGAAIATVVAQFSAATVGLIFNLKVNKEINFRPEILIPKSETMKNIWKVGFPAALQQAISPMLTFGMNQILLTFTTAAPAVYVIYIRLQSLILIPVWGLKNTVVSIISYNFGAKNKERILETMKICIIATICITLAGLCIFQAIPALLLSLFNAQGEVLDIGMTALRIVSISFPFAGITLLFGAFFQALGFSTRTLITSIIQFCLMLLTAYFLSKTGSIALVWIAFPITELIVSLIATAFLRSINKNMIQNI